MIKQASLAGLCLLVAAASALSATIPVTTTADGGAGSLRKAIADAASGDTIVFQIPKTDFGFNPITGYWTVLLTGATAANKTFVIDKDLTIDASAQNILIRRDPVAPADFRIFTIPAALPRFNVALIHLWISNGNVTSESGGGLARNGGGIANFGTLTVRDCTFTGNAAPEGGGAIFNFNQVTVQRSTFSGNSAGFGGAICNSGARTDYIDSCTITANSAPEGAGIYNNHSTVVIKSSTIAGNTSTGGPRGGGGLATDGGVQYFENSIIVGNTSTTLGPDVTGTVSSGGHNLLGSTADTSGFNGAGDQTGVTSAQVNLRPLADYGGAVRTMPPRPGSFAIDKGKRASDAGVPAVTTDQRGLARPVDRSEGNSPNGDGTDIGAVELGLPQPGPTFTVNTVDERISGECTTYDCSLIDALNVANAVADANTIHFAAHVRGTILTNNLTPTGLAITNPVTINGPGADVLSLSAQSFSRILRVTSSNVTISGLRFDFGKTTNEDGACIHNSGGLTLNNCRVHVGSASGSGNGGGVYNSSTGTLTIYGCAFTGNQAGQFGGGVYSDGILAITNSTFVGNRALRGGGIISRAFGGAARATIRNCTITQNEATDGVNMPGFGGGGLFVEGGAQQYHIGNTIVAGNSSTNNPDVRGNYTSDGHNLIGRVGDAAGLVNGNNGDQVGTAGSPVNPQFDTFGDNGGSTATYSLLGNSPAINAGDNDLAPPTDQRGYGRNGVSDIGAFEFAGLLPVTLANISTRLRVETGDNVLIGGFIITGTQNKKVIIRAIGPSLPFAGRLDNPTLELRDGAGTLLDSNDDWMNSPNKQAILDTTIPPANDLESAIVATLPANAAGYTAIVRGANGGTGIGVVEAYDLDRTVDSKLANISTRGFVSTGDNVLIAGTIVLGNTTQKVIIRAIGPSLPIGGKLENPTLELRDGNGAVLEANDNWVDSPNEQAILDSTIAPSNDLESAIVRTLSPAGYTAIVRGVNDSTGIAVIEVYALQ